METRGGKCFGPRLIGYPSGAMRGRRCCCWVGATMAVLAVVSGGISAELLHSCRMPARALTWCPNLGWVLSGVFNPGVASGWPQGPMLCRVEFGREGADDCTQGWPKSSRPWRQWWWCRLHLPVSSAGTLSGRSRKLCLLQVLPKVQLFQPICSQLTEIIVWLAQCYWGRTWWSAYSWHMIFLWRGPPCTSYWNQSYPVAI